MNIEPPMSQTPIAVQNGHPKGLYVLFATEMWERFNYYGMRAVLVLFMTKALLFDKVFASNLYGGYTGLVYLTPLIGGFIADRYWGNKRSIIAGGLLMAIGEFILFFCGSLYQTNESLSSMLFFSGLGFMIAGNGFFKPNISSLVGQLYPKGDRRIDPAYTIFYMGINVGGALGPFVCGLVGDTGNPDDFKWAFLAGGIGMLLSVVTQLLFQKKYVVAPDGSPLGLVPKDSPKSFSNPLFIGIGLALLATMMIGMLYIDAKVFSFLTYLLIASALYIVFFVLSDKTLSKIEKERVGVIFIVSFFVIFFWSAFEQAGASLTFFAEEQTQRQLGSFLVPASFFQSLNSLFVVSFAPLFAWLWIKLGKREPASPTKMAWGLLLLAIGYFWIATGVKDVSANVKVSMMWLIGMYALHTWGELCLSPIGLSLVNKLAPLKFASLLMAVWFLANAAANKLAGVLSTLYPPGMSEIKKAAEQNINLEGILAKTVTPTTEEIAKLKELKIPFEYKSVLGFEINNLNEFFMLFVFMAGTASLILFLLTKKLQKMMHEGQD
ncbi:peptide ABC transporter [Flavihumibacter stibioxidans]|uniref:Peptide ABC transporter n=2 Tax=Flavihumibacter stibioxidans TaxID=1834163 RepID=A0ABR7M7D7_9BACT|nr:peptide ABC transporter [Flavihumibacter stibioxidans]